MRNPIQSPRTKLAAFLQPGVDAAAWVETCAAMVRTKPSGWLALPEAERHALEAACRPGLERLGYL